MRSEHVLSTPKWSDLEHWRRFGDTKPWIEIEAEKLLKQLGKVTLIKLVIYQFCTEDPPFHMGLILMSDIAIRYNIINIA